MKRLFYYAPLAVAIAAVIVWMAPAFRGFVASAESPRSLPMPAVDLPPGSATSSVAVLAGGCFWGVQGVFQHVKGVTSAISGYAGGDKGGAHYEIVGTGTTGHAESVRVTYDPRQVSYGRLLQIFFSVVHDPTQLNRQGLTPGRNIARRSSPPPPTRPGLRRPTFRN
jgi:peptide-methionine (S)-S-oxide reductase